MRKNTLSIHSENILPIIKKWLYSSRDIFLRELISNACDAIKKLRVLRECGQASDDALPLEIHVSIDKLEKTITISDNGIGMTEEEVEKYIAQIAFSGAEEFLAKYKKESEADPIIGHFGLGFYSSYMVSQKVELKTLSYLADAKPVFWSCDGSSSYEIGLSDRKERGTDIILHLSDEHEEFLQESKIRELLERYCSFMPDPIFLSGKPINNGEPLWCKSPASCSQQDYLEFYRKLYPLKEDPLFWIHLNVDYPFRLQGVLYFPRAADRLENKLSKILLFCNRVYVSDECNEILPEYMMTLRGAIDSPDIPLNVSRSYLQIDQKVRQLGAHISKKIADKLTSLFKTDRDSYAANFADIEWFLKLGLLQDEKFRDRVKEILIWKNNHKEWTTAQEYLDRAKEKKIYYCREACGSKIQQVYLDRGIELLYLSNAIDSPVLSALELGLGAKFQSIDSELDEALIDASREKTLLDADGKTLSTRIADHFRAELPKELTIEAKSLSSDSIAGLLLVEEQMRRMRDFDILTQDNKGRHAWKLGQTFVVNTNNKLVQAAYRLAEKKPDLSKQLAIQIYDLARLSQKELESNEVEQVLARQQSLLEELVETT